MRTMRWVAFLAAAALVLPACGGDDETTTTVDEPAATTTVDEPAATITIADEPAATTTIADEPAATITTADEPAATTEPPPESTTTSDVTTTAPPPDDAGDVSALLGSGDLAMTVTSPAGGVSGRILDVTLTNEGLDDQIVLLPCGYVFEPAAEEQRMMTVQPETLALGPGDTTTFSPHVMCIDSGLPAPEGGSVYGIGTMATDELLALAECVCTRDLATELDPVMGDMSLQFAVWTVADGDPVDIGDEMTDLEGALGDLVGGELGIDLEELADMPGMEGIDLDAMLAQASQFMDDYQLTASRWLDECGIELTDD